VIGCWRQRYNMDWWTKRPDGVARAERDRRPSVTELFSDLFIGEYLREEDVAWLKESFGVTAIHNLQDQEDFAVHGLDAKALLAACRDNGVHLVRTPIPDGSADHVAIHLESAMAELKSLIERGERVYLHCNAGLNRAPTIAIAHMRAYRGMSLNEAVAHVKQRRACGPFMTVLEDYFGSRDFKPDK
jgi:protein-tyrosine phosphatase